MLRRAAWPMRKLMSQLLREKHECLSETTRTYFRDVYDHCVQIIDLIETYREIAAGVTETYMSAVSNRMNEIMKVLTIISTIFMPLSFLAGVYGMNMYVPEAKWRGMYGVFWAICVSAAAACCSGSTAGSGSETVAPRFRLCPSVSSKEHRGSVPFSRAAPSPEAPARGANYPVS